MRKFNDIINKIACEDNIFIVFFFIVIIFSLFPYIIKYFKIIIKITKKKKNYEINNIKLIKMFPLLS